MPHADSHRNPVLAVFASRLVVALVAFVGLAALGAGSASAQPVGFVAAMEGDVSLIRSGETSWQAATIHQDVELGDTIRTGLDASVKLVLADDTTLTLGEDTELVIDSFVVSEDALTEPSVIRQLKGELRTRIGEAFGGASRIQIHTPTAVMGVKGTTMSIQVAAQGEATLGCNDEGSVYVTLHGDDTEYDVPEGQCREVTADQVGDPIERPDSFPPVRTPPPPSRNAVNAALMGGGAIDQWVLASDPLPPVGSGGSPFEPPVDGLEEPFEPGNKPTVTNVAPPSLPPVVRPPPTLIEIPGVGVPPAPEQP
jgi:hypothetical protein